MAGDGTHVRVVLRWIQIMNKLEPAWKEKGEFRFTARVSSDDRGGIFQETTMPEEGHYAISDHPRENKLDKMNRVLFDGRVDDHLVVEMTGEEIDVLSANDPLGDYRREFRGDPTDWVGRYHPGDEASDDPENMPNWRICYDVELA